MQPFGRHRQLLTVLEGETGILDERLPDLLKAKFDEDQCIDEVFALWSKCNIRSLVNESHFFFAPFLDYTRAMLAFKRKGRCGKSKRLLKYAITTNCYVPPLLLHWEGQKSCGSLIISIGHETEAHDYANDNRKYWRGCKGALGMYVQWMYIIAEIQSD